MGNLGMGVMLHALAGTDRGADVLDRSKGKRIASMRMDDADDGRLVMMFADGTGLAVRDAGQSCCESRYIRTDDDLDWYSTVAAELVDIELREGPDVPHEYGDHETQFVVITTTRGVVTLCAHNEHNGYYGGFYMVIDGIGDEGDARDGAA